MKRQRNEDAPPITRAEVWIEAHKRKDGSIPIDVSSHMERVQDLLCSQEVDSQDIRNDPLTKVLSNTIKQKSKEKAGKWEVPLPKVKPVAEDEMFCVIWSGKRKRAKLQQLEREKGILIRFTIGHSYVLFAMTPMCST
ncbi:hypothetical protein AAC387_Pa11g0842 [Persea americana]